MQTISEHRKRVAYLRETLETLVAHHRKLFDLRSQSWHEQLEGDPDRQERLDELHREIAEVEVQIEYMKGGLDAIEPSGALASQPADPPESDPPESDSPGAANGDRAEASGSDSAEDAPADAANGDPSSVSDDAAAEGPDSGSGESPADPESEPPVGSA